MGRRGEIAVTVAFEIDGASVYEPNTQFTIRNTDAHMVLWSWAKIWWACPPSAVAFPLYEWKLPDLQGLI